MDRPGEPLETATESALIERTLRGEGEDVHGLVRPFTRNPLTTAVSILKTEADAPEIAQGAHLQGFRRLSGFRQESFVRTMLAGNTVNGGRRGPTKDPKYTFEPLGGRA